MGRAWDEILCPLAELEMRHQSRCCSREGPGGAHALVDLPQISDAFRRGTVSFSRVRAMTRVATPENEEYLMMIARHGTASHVEHLVRQFRKVKRIEALEQENQRHALCYSMTIQTANQQRVFLPPCRG